MHAVRALVIEEEVVRGIPPEALIARVVPMRGVLLATKPGAFRL